MDLLNLRDAGVPTIALRVYQNIGISSATDTGARDPVSLGRAKSVRFLSPMHLFGAAVRIGALDGPFSASLRARFLQ